MTLDKNLQLYALYSGTFNPAYWEFGLWIAQ